MKNIIISIGFIFFFISSKIEAQQQQILLYVSHEDTYYSEYVVMKAALEASGYLVDVRSASGDSASTYMIPNGTDIVATANSLSGSNYAEFLAHYQNQFGSTWDASLNNTASHIPTNGRIEDVANMNNYDAIVIAGGTGIQAYRLDGNYAAQGSGARQLSALQVQAASEHLNDLIIDALLNGKPVLGQCHAASIPLYCRVPGTTGSGAEALGYSILKDAAATGYPEPQTGTSMSALNVTQHIQDRLTISSPHSSLNDDGRGDAKILTSRDWYPQTVAFAARALLNVLETYPSKDDRSVTVSVLILHGGAVDSTNCSPFNRANDIPCNYGSGSNNLPADYRYVASLLEGNSANDEFDFEVYNQNITAASLPYDANNQASIETYLQQYDVVLFFKHWCTGITDELQNAMVAYTDAGGGMIGLHHALYNDIDAGLDKNIIAQQLFGTESAENGWSANPTNYNFINSNYGHFVSTFGVEFSASSVQAPATWSTNTPLDGANLSQSYYPQFSIYDELYNNQRFISGQTFGRAENDITPLFSNDQNPDGQAHTSGFVKLFNPSQDSSLGRLAFFQAGERRENISINHPYGQVIRNAVIWCANKDSISPATNTLHFVDASEDLLLFPNPADMQISIKSAAVKGKQITIFDINGRIHMLRKVNRDKSAEYLQIDISHLASGIYFMRVGNQRQKFVKR